MPFVAGLALLTSCENCETPTTAQLTLEDTNWLAYVNPVPSDGKPDTIRFTNEVNATIKFVRTQLHSATVPGDGYSFEDKCIEQMDTQASSVIQDVARKMPGLAVSILRKPADLKVHLLVDGLGVYEIDEQNPTHPSLTVNNKVYANVFEVNVPGNDNDNKGKVKQILFNKTDGFIKVDFYGGKHLQL